MLRSAKRNSQFRLSINIILKDVYKRQPKKAVSEKVKTETLPAAEASTYLFPPLELLNPPYVSKDKHTEEDISCLLYTSPFNKNVEGIFSHNRISKCICLFKNESR